MIRKDLFMITHIDNIYKINIKSACKFFALLLIPVLLTSCFLVTNVSKRPYFYGDAKWISEDPDIFFIVDNSMEYSWYLRGEVIYDGEIRLCVFSFIDNTDQVHVFIIDDIDKPYLDAGIAGLFGVCSFSEEKLEIKVDKGDTLFNGEYETLTFYRTEFAE